MTVLRNAFEIMLLSSLTGSVAFLIWWIWKKQMIKQEKYRQIYPLLLVVLTSFGIPYASLALYVERKLMQPGYEQKSAAGAGESWSGLGDLCVAIWLIGVILVLIRFAGEYFRLQKAVRETAFPAKEQTKQELADICRKMQIPCDMKICHCSVSQSPFVMGFFQKCIVLPLREYSRQELQIILYHEVTHMHQHILSWKYLAHFMRAVHWFNPILGRLAKELDIWSEVACDIYVCDWKEGGFSLKDYYQLTVDEVEHHCSGQKCMQQEWLVHHSKNGDLRNRMEILGRYDRKKELCRAGAMALTMVFLVACVITAQAFGVGIHHITAFIW